jgi:lipopolysaccharide transport system permease protein
VGLRWPVIVAPPPTRAEAVLPRAPTGRLVRLAEARGYLARHLQLLLSLSDADMRVRYGRGPWRLFKWLADPFAALGVYFLLIIFVLDRPGPAPGLMLACAVIPFQLVMATVSNAVDCASTRASIIVNMAFPRSLLPASSAVTESVAFLASLPALGILMAVYGVTPSAALLWLPGVLALNFALAAAIAYPAALLTLWVRDLRLLIISLVRASFFVSAGLVPLSQIEGHAHQLLQLSPLTGLFESYRAVLVAGHAPSLLDLGPPLIAAAVIAAVFVPVYRSEEPYLPKAML